MIPQRLKGIYDIKVSDKKSFISSLHCITDFLTLICTFIADVIGWCKSSIYITTGYMYEALYRKTSSNLKNLKPITEKIFIDANS